MAKRDAAGALKYSSNLMGMRFMQRAVAKSELVEKAKEQKKQEKKQEEEESIVAPSRGKGVQVLIEPDPPPGAVLGHMSFQKYNTHVESLWAEKEEELQAIERDAELRRLVEQQAASDTEMAERLGKSTAHTE